MPVVSHALGMDHARDLGEQAPDQAAYAAWAKALRVQLPSAEANYTFASRHDFAGSVAVTKTVPENVIMAIREFGTPAPGISDVHVRFHDGSAETSAMVDLAPWGYPVSGPIYAAWSLEVTGPHAATVKISTLSFCNLGVPGDISSKAQVAINDYLAARLPQISGLSMKSVTLVDGGVKFDGTVPVTYSADPPKAGQLP